VYFDTSTEVSLEDRHKQAREQAKGEAIHGAGFISHHVMPFTEQHRDGVNVCAGVLLDGGTRKPASPLQIKCLLHSAPTNPPEALKTLLQYWKTTTGLGAAPKEGWKQQKFGSDASNAAISGDDADPDKDGVVNLLEYAFGSDPVNGRDEALPKPSMTVVDGKPVLGITFQRSLSATDVRYQVEYSSDQVTWTAGNTYAYDEEVTATADVVSAVLSEAIR
jgi:hypothetical protein